MRYPSSSKVGHFNLQSTAVLKRGGKQIKRSLKTKDGALAKRRLKDLTRTGRGGDARVTFEMISKRWLLLRRLNIESTMRLINRHMIGSD